MDEMISDAPRGPWLLKTFAGGLVQVGRLTTLGLKRVGRWLAVVEDSERVSS